MTIQLHTGERANLLCDPRRDPRAKVLLKSF